MTAIPERWPRHHPRERLRHDPAPEPPSAVDSAVDSAVVARAVLQQRVDGYAVVEGVVPLEKVRAWHAAIMPLLADRIERAASNRGPRRYCMRMPFVGALHRSRLQHASGGCCAVMRAVMGEDIVCALITSDTPFPGAPDQEIHRDTTQLCTSIPLALPCCSLVLNIPLVDYTPDNGPMEIWPGGTRLAGDDLDLAILSPRMRIRCARWSERDRSCSATCARAAPGRSTHARPNLTATYTPPWHRLLEIPVTMPASSYAAMDARMRAVFRLARVVADADALSALDQTLNP